MMYGHTNIKYISFLVPFQVGKFVKNDLPSLIFFLTYLLYGAEFFLRS